MILTENVKYILKSLTDAGYRADVVGGPVRDYLLGKAPSDYDITTSALPSEVKAVFSAHKTLDTGIKHGTVTLILDGEPYEITTYRVDGEYKDSRHPECVTFTARIEEDLARRDFTVNAMAYGIDGQICDPFGGRDDLERRLIRAVGVAHERFSEDALRILRGIRFASVLGFAIEDDTAAAMRDLAPTLDRISAERIYTEWCKLLTGDGAYDVIEKYFDIITVFLPELSGAKLPQRDAFNLASPTVRQLSLFASFSDSASRFSSAMMRLKSPTAVRECGTAVLGALESASFDTDEQTGLILHKIGEGHTRELLSLCILLGKCTADDKNRLETYVCNARPYRISDLAVGGNDLLALGIKGRAIGAVLEELILSVISGKVENSKDSLCELASRLNNI